MTATPVEQLLESLAVFHHAVALQPPRTLNAKRRRFVRVPCREPGVFKWRHESLVQEAA